MQDASYVEQLTSKPNISSYYCTDPDHELIHEPFLVPYFFSAAMGAEHAKWEMVALWLSLTPLSRIS